MSEFSASASSPDVHISRDDAGHVRALRHPREPLTAAQIGAEQPSARGLADAYVHRIASMYELDAEEVSDLTAAIGAQPVAEGPRLKFGEEKAVADIVTVSYQQTALELPIWQAALEVRLYGEPLAVAGSTSTLHYDVEVEPPTTPALEASSDDKSALVDALGFDEDARRQLRINDARFIVYRYDPEERVDPTASPGGESDLEGGPPTLPLPPVPDIIKPGHHYVVREVLFSLPPPNWGDLNWRVFIEPETRAVLYLRALVASQTACVFARDPVTRTGNNLTGCSAEATLNGARTDVTLLGLDPPNAQGVQALSGEFVAIRDTDPPTVAPPTTTNPFDFCYSAVADDFAAASAYFHYDGAYRLVQNVGINVASYFDGTTFPVPVDHQGMGTQVNARAAGNAAGNGMGKFINGLAATGCPVGIATDVRVVLHEFGHALLWDHVNSPNFGWCHSAGDTLGAVLCDPGSRAPDRFVTFPFVTGGRRHDRDVAAGWAWGGTEDDRQYGSEQILSTLLFRVYRVTGGDDRDIEVQRFAARYLAFLIVTAIGTLTVTTTDPRVFATALMDADESTTSFEGHPGGAWHKVIRWSFEQQGLYQPAGAPTPVTSPGAPPDIDVYIDDGRGGVYAPYLPDEATTSDVWSRNAPDGGLVHEDPLPGVTSHAYVRVRNRGTQAASGVTVRLFQSNPGGRRRWPDDWAPAATPEMAAQGPVAPNGEAVVGPFAWTPSAPGPGYLLASASAPGDPSNLDTVNGPLPHRRLVPFDNNIAQRRVVHPDGAPARALLLDRDPPSPTPWLDLLT